MCMEVGWEREGHARVQVPKEARSIRHTGAGVPAACELTDMGGRN